MANRNHVAVVRDGADAINAWRAKRRRRFDLRGADLRYSRLTDADLHLADLSHANLREADLRRADLSKAVLSNADLSRAELRQAVLKEANLTQANLARASLVRADLHFSNLSGADLSKAHLTGANLVGADLRGANLNEADLSYADLTEADLRNAALTNSVMSSTILNATALSAANFTGTKLWNAVLGSDLSEINGIEQVDHGGPSRMTLDALWLSGGRIPASFLRGCGLSDWEIAAARLYSPALSREEVDSLLYEVSALRSGAAIQISPLFISYSRADTAFVDELEIWLTDKGIRFWRDAQHSKAGRVEKQLTRAIAMNPTFLLILSRHSVDSDWVEWEAAKARELEQELGRDVLCPVALDNAWKTSQWPGPLRRQIERYHILDFSRWQDADVFKLQFEKLVDGLRLFYQPPRS